ncbi:formate dehydrogenase accessory protein FdhE [Roseomonas sp. GCM10028921]
MSGFNAIQPDPSGIGRLLKPAFAVLPDPPVLFRQRAERFEVLAQEGAMAPYLRFLARLSEVQAELAAELPLQEPIPEQVERARANGMPPLDRAGLVSDPVLRATISRFLLAMEAVGMPRQASDALAWLRRTTPEMVEEMLGNIVADSIPFDALPAHLFLSAAVQVHAARLAATLDAERLVPVETGLCPVCGGPPVSSMVIGRPGAEGTRYAACSCCGTQWNEVRVKCLACGSTKGVGYKAPEGEEATVKAETCDSCRSWVKILYQDRNPSLEPVADDVASLGLDMMMGETEYRRAGFDPFLLGY